MSSGFQEVRTRFAPSPTGYLHVGGARTALYNYLFAKKMNGKFILRIEDTDQARSTVDSLKMVIEDLQWLQLSWDEGPHPVTLEDQGGCGPYYQSRRLDIYKKYADQLLESGKAYYCFLTDAELTAQREQAMAAGRPPQVQSPYENMSLSEAREKIAQGQQAVVRFKTRHLKKDFLLQDLVRGEVRFPSDMVGDFVLLRSDGMPVYNFCCVVDDALMKISHVLRAEEHLPNTLRQLMIYEALNFPLPQFGHISLVLDEERQKLSKRKGATSCHEFKELGYLPEALKNFIALLGWSHPEGHEMISMDEMIRTFSVDRLNPSGAVFDVKKLKWMNAQYLRALASEEIWKNCQPFFQRDALELPKDPEWQKKSVDVFRTSMETFADAVELYRPLSDKSFVIHDESKEALTWESTQKVLTSWMQGLEAMSEKYLTEEQFLKLQDQVKDQAGVKGKFLFMPIRVAVIGKPHGAELKILVPLLARESLLDRVRRVLAAGVSA
jgi:nondiscriminating glutamyl-tRNA synthetase